MQRIDLLLERANIDMTPGLFLLCSVGAAGVTFVLCSLLGQPTPVVIIFSLIALVCPYGYVQYVIWKRLRKFLEQFPDGLDMIAQSLQAGLGLTQAMVFVAKEMPDPLGTEFSVFIEEVNLGLPLVDALKKFEERMNLPEVRLFNTALMVQREVGGSLAELLNKLSDIIRDRFRIERLIKSLTAQNRVSAWTVCSVPPFLAVFMFIREPEMMAKTMAHPMGRMMFAAALVLEILGFWFSARLSRFISRNSPMELLIAVGVFGLISGVVYFVVASRAPVSDEVIQRRLENINVKAESRISFVCMKPMRLRLGVRCQFFYRR